MIEIRGIPGPSQLRGRVTRQLEKALAPIRATPVTARVVFSDEDGPRGGVGHRCAITVRLPRQPALRVAEQAATARQAFDASFDVLIRRLARQRERRGALRRRPKKYYVAKRLLTESPPGGLR
jgi:ribosome-associated translation inhibitor RaiA